MNPKNLIPIAAFFIGAASGVLGAWYILDKKYSLRADEEIESIKEWARGEVLRYKNRAEQAEAQHEADQESIRSTVNVQESEHLVSFAKPSLVDAVRQSRASRYHNVPQKVRNPEFQMQSPHDGAEHIPTREEDPAAYEHPEDDPPEDDDISETPDWADEEAQESRVSNRETGTSNGSSGPYVISESEFSYGDLPQDKETVNYYDGDDTLIDEDESVMIIEDTIGYEALREFNEDDIVYVRNERLGVDYEVILNHGSWSHEMLGIEEDPREYDRRRRMRDGEWN